MEDPNFAHGLAVTVINDGNGEQCGLTYSDRVFAAKRGRSPRTREWVNAALTAARWLEARFDHEYSASEILAAASEVADHYERHIKEGA